MSIWTPKELREVNDRLNSGEAPTATVRELLQWFGVHRRRYRIVGCIRRVLKDLNLETEPDFEAQYIDGNIRFTRSKCIVIDSGTGVSVVVPPVTMVVDDKKSETSSAYAPTDPSHRLSRLDAAHNKPTCVVPTALLETATTLMLRNDFSQLPVMSGERDVKGMISWKTIGMRLAIGQPVTEVRHCMDNHIELNIEDSIFDAILLIEKHECVLVRNRNDGNTISGLVTAADISNQFKKLAEPFLLLEDIENLLRTIIGSHFTPAELQKAKDPSDLDRQIEDVTDLTFGEYVRLLENPEQWCKLGLKLDRSQIIDELGKVRDIRNDVMHFDPDGIEEKSLSLLRSCAKLLEQVTKLKSDKVKSTN